MFAIYSLLIRLYNLIAWTLSPFYPKAYDWTRGRKGQIDKIKDQLQLWKNRKIIWIHAASYGEFEMSWPIIRAIRECDDELRFVVSFYSPSGYKRIDLDPAFFLKIYLPLDLASNQEDHIRLIKPSAVLFIKYEFWFNFLKKLKENKIPYFFIGLHLEKSSYLFSALMKDFLDLIRSSRRIYTHSVNSNEILLEHGFDRLSPLGDLRILQVEKNKNESPLTLNWPDKNQACIVYGSVTKKELPHVIETVLSLPDCNHILALHDVEDKYIRIIQRSALQASFISNTKAPKSNLIVVDSYGQLKYLYNKADLAYIGGAFEKGPHNVLEAMIYGVPVIIGPNVKKFPFAKDCIKNDIILSFTELEQMSDLIGQQIKADHRDRIRRSMQFIQNNKPDINELIDELRLILLDA